MSVEHSGVGPRALAHSLHGVAYPAGKAQLLAQAQRNGAPEAVLDLLQRLDADAFYGPQDVLNAAVPRPH